MMSITTVTWVTVGAAAGAVIAGTYLHCRNQRTAAWQAIGTGLAVLAGLLLLHLQQSTYGNRWLGTSLAWCVGWGAFGLGTSVVARTLWRDRRRRGANAAAEAPQPTDDDKPEEEKPVEDSAGSKAGTGKFVRYELVPVKCGDTVKGPGAPASVVTVVTDAERIHAAGFVVKLLTADGVRGAISDTVYNDKRAADRFGRRYTMNETSRQT